MAIWRDLTAQQFWQYQELPPFPLLQFLDLDPRAADESECARAFWFWLDRPKLILGDGWLPGVLGALCATLFPIIPFIGSPPTLGSELTMEITIFIFELVLAITLVRDKVRLVRWRREYEASVNRLIRTIYRGV